MTSRICFVSLRYVSVCQADLSRYKIQWCFPRDWQLSYRIVLIIVHKTTQRDRRAIVHGPNRVYVRLMPVLGHYWMPHRNDNRSKVA